MILRPPIACALALSLILSLGCARASAQDGVPPTAPPQVSSLDDTVQTAAKDLVGKLRPELNGPVAVFAAIDANGTRFPRGRRWALDLTEALRGLQSALPPVAFEDVDPRNDEKVFQAAYMAGPKCNFRLYSTISGGEIELRLMNWDDITEASATVPLPTEMAKELAEAASRTPTPTPVVLTPEQIKARKAVIARTSDLLYNLSPTNRSPVIFFPTKTPPVYLDGENVELKLTSGMAGYLSVIAVSKDGTPALLVPNSDVPEFQVVAGVPVDVLPMTFRVKLREYMAEGKPMVEYGKKTKNASASAPFGKETVRAIVTSYPIDWAGLERVHKEGERFYSINDETALKQVVTQLKSMDWAAGTIELETRPKPAAP